LKRVIKVLFIITILFTIIVISFSNPTLSATELNNSEGNPLQYTLEGLTRSAGVRMTTGSLGGWNEDEWVPFRLTITNTEANLQVFQAAINQEYENDGRYGIDAFASCFANSADCGNGRTPTPGPSAVGSGTLWKILVNSSEYVPTIIFDTLPGGVKTIQWRTSDLSVPANSSLLIEWSVHLAKGNSTNLACTEGSPLGPCTPQDIPPGMGESSWPGRSLQVRTAPPIPGERTVSIDVAQTSACVIATATYGSHLEPEVVYMRSVRDDMIGSTKVGGLLVSGWNSFYYCWSPSIAHMISSNVLAQKISKVLIMPLVTIIHLTAAIYSITKFFNTSVASIVAFLFASTSSTTIYIAIPIYGLLAISKKKFHKK
jgi:hypothetical protein